MTTRSKKQRQSEQWSWGTNSRRNAELETLNCASAPRRNQQFLISISPACSWSRFLPGRFPPSFIEAWEITQCIWGAPGEHRTINYFCRLYKEFPSYSYLISQGVQWLSSETAEKGQELGADTEINPCQPDPSQAQYSQHGWTRAQSRRFSQCLLWHRYD